jgi:hypothetical protein
MVKSSRQDSTLQFLLLFKIQPTPQMQLVCEKRDPFVDNLLFCVHAQPIITQLFLLFGG